jgi:hypothetical protein
MHARNTSSRSPQAHEAPGPAEPTDGARRGLRRRGGARRAGVAHAALRPAARRYNLTAFRVRGELGRDFLEVPEPLARRSGSRCL